jgi:hypothetical protein
VTKNLCHAGDQPCLHVHSLPRFDREEHTIVLDDNASGGMSVWLSTALG